MSWFRHPSHPQLVVDGQDLTNHVIGAEIQAEYAHSFSPIIPEPDIVLTLRLRGVTVLQYEDHLGWTLIASSNDPEFGDHPPPPERIEVVIDDKA